jgi:S-DNA-T family DNA segregation ATPase FtsK/SpoIIIE
MHVQERVQEEEAAQQVPRGAVVPEEQAAYTFPSIDLLDRAEADEYEVDYDELEENKQILLDKLETYKIQITDINAIVGPTVTLYELTPAPGVKISRIKSLEDDLAMAMAARGIRMIAPIPGKSAIGVEIPNRQREFVRVRDLIATKKFQDTKMELPVPLGKTIEGEAFLIDLAKQPHMLIAGATGSGKSVGVNALINGLVYAVHPANLKFVLIDPKKIELQQYARLLDNYVAMPEDATDPIITDFTLALGALQSCEREMERRYDLLSDAMVRGIREYNQKLAKGGLREEEGHRHLPYIVVIVDELADLMMTAGKDIEAPIARLAQMARAVGIHLVLATQRPSVDVITGLIKANFPARVAYQVASKIDSRTIMDQNGAEGLVGNGDLLYSLGSTMVRLQGPFVDIDEVDRVTEFIAEQDGPGPYLLPPAEPDDEDGPDGSALRDMTDRDELFDEAARIIVHSQQGSVSLLQRKLSVGYSRAARLVDQLEEAGILGPFEGAKARQVLVPDDASLDALLSGEVPE